MSLVYRGYRTGKTERLIESRSSRPCEETHILPSKPMNTVDILAPS